MVTAFYICENFPVIKWKKLNYAALTYSTHPPKQYNTRNSSRTPFIEAGTTNESTVHHSHLKVLYIVR